MTNWQKAIKYIAVGLAICLVIGIVGGILGAIGIFTGIFGGENGVTEEMKTYAVSQDITKLKMEIAAADLTVTIGDGFAVESNLKYVTVEEENGCLILSETKRIGRRYSGKAKLTLTLPAGCVLDDADITTGAGRVTIETLSAKQLHLELGAGEVTVDELHVTAKAEIEGGAGKLTIGGGTLHNLDLDMGVGELQLTSRLQGECDLSYGVGKATLVLVGTADDYRVDVQKGLGAASIDGQSVRDDTVYGTGDTRVDIEGGIGEISVQFKKEN